MQSNGNVDGFRRFCNIIIFFLKNHFQLECQTQKVDITNDHDMEKLNILNAFHQSHACMHFNEPENV